MGGADSVSQTHAVNNHALLQAVMTKWLWLFVTPQLQLRHLELSHTL